VTDQAEPDARRQITLSIAENVAEIDLVLPLVRQMHKESIFSDLPFDEEQYRRICMFIGEKPSHHGGMFIQHEGEPVAFAYYNLRPFMGSRKTWVTYMHTLYIRSDLRSTALGGYMWERIVTTAKGWSIPRQSRGIFFSVISAIAVEETDLVMRGTGATHLGGNYFLRL
jgi:hypothetical protein